MSRARLSIFPPCLSEHLLRVIMRKIKMKIFHELTLRIVLAESELCFFKLDYGDFPEQLV